MLTVETLYTDMQEVGWSIVELQLLKEVPLLDGYQESLPARQLQLVVLLLVREAAPYSETVDRALPLARMFSQTSRLCLLPIHRPASLAKDHNRLYYVHH